MSLGQLKESKAYVRAMHENNGKVLLFLVNVHFSMYEEYIKMVSNHFYILRTLIREKMVRSGSVSLLLSVPKKFI